jgi:Uma2 family endonuclease
MASTSDVLVSVDEYLHTAYDPDCDYVDGRVEERNVGEGPHSRLQIALSAYLFNQERKLNIRVWPEQRVRVSPTRYRIPDVCVTRGGGPVPRILESAPLICMEILSSEDRMPHVLRRLDDYVTPGVTHIWLFDPFERIGYTYSPSRSLKLSDDGIFTAPEIPLTIDLAECFAAIEE